MPVFVKIVAMHSELVCLDKEGNLYQWKWEDPGPFPSERGSKLTHPKTKSLGLLNESVVKLSACSSRATVATRSGKVTLELALILWKLEQVTI
jgi:E3 ubiquitin-protein ligase EDD1